MKKSPSFYKLKENQKEVYNLNNLNLNLFNLFFLPNERIKNAQQEALGFSHLCRK